jgi:single-strand DNA-binding protein
MNNVTIKGRLTKDFTTNYTSTGFAFAKTGIAESNRYKDKNGETKETVKFFNVEAKGKRAERFAKLAGKGKLVHINGYLDQEKWQDKDGKSRESVKIVILDMTPIDTSSYKAEAAQKAA